jgi:hypothetical protein
VLVRLYLLKHGACVWQRQDFYTSNKIDFHRVCMWVCVFSIVVFQPTFSGTAKFTPKRNGYVVWYCKTQSVSRKMGVTDMLLRTVNPDGDDDANPDDDDAKMRVTGMSLSTVNPDDDAKGHESYYHHNSWECEAAMAVRLLPGGLEIGCRDIDGDAGAWVAARSWLRTWLPTEVVGWSPGDLSGWPTMEHSRDRAAHSRCMQRQAAVWWRGLHGDGGLVSYRTFLFLGASLRPLASLVRAWSAFCGQKANHRSWRRLVLLVATGAGFCASSSYLSVG